MEHYKYLLMLFIFGSILFLNNACNNNEEINDEKETLQTDEKPQREVELEYFQTDAGWGYDVIINGKNYIHQTHLPCECGGEGFASKEKAMKAAEFLKQKIENYDRSLQISRAQLDSLGAL